MVKKKRTIEKGCDIKIRNVKPSQLVRYNLLLSMNKDGYLKLSRIKKLKARRKRG